MREDAQHRATEFVKELYAAGDLDASGLDASVAGILAARTESELAEIVRSLPPPIAVTSPERRLTEPLEIHSGLGRLRLTGRWQVGIQTHVSADLGSITIVVPRGVDVQVIRNRGGLSSHLEPAIPGLPLIRLDATTNIGRIRLRHPVSSRRPPKGAPR